jgi:hypothetical protein
MPFTKENASEIASRPRNPYGEIASILVPFRFPPSLLARLDEARGDTPRSKVVVEALELWLKSR